MLIAAKTVIGMPKRVVWNVLKPSASKDRERYDFGGEAGISNIMPKM
jgi:hypothetical protein